ncbi:helix-turn-helix domain-containing protein [Methylorubrum extorquens]|jgi:transcriptional regulator with XRE-family HTH domain|uniref:helix-turn-helix domain-containing protein n=1 Tax=Methylorubrum extorquens TaxID=408 RepID=UPI001EE5AAF2|nr:helix-turn-helix transcriptional regulator [Methylorubrum extorquens]MCG5248250.1 helix-turn-helix domain-containing protein [Methylorubrum extorquens]
MAVPLDARSGEVGQTTVLDEGFNYTVAIKIFQASPDISQDIDFASAREFPPDQVVPGYLCQAARLLVGLTQQELHVLARVSKKSINDYENGFIAIRVALAERLAAALRGGGARFIAGEGFVGVIVSGRRAGAGRSPAPSRQGAPDGEDAAPSEPAGISAAVRPSRVRRAKPAP